MTSLTKKEIMLFVKNALKSNNKIKMKKAELYYNKWKSCQRNYFYELPDDIISLINGLVQNDPLFSYKSAKKLSCEELHNLSIKDKSIEVNMDELQVGDYIEFSEYRMDYYYMVSRRTKSYIFLHGVPTSNFFISTAPEDMGGLIYSYFYVNIKKDKTRSKVQFDKKMKIKNQKITKAIDNFIAIECFDMGH
jgi:hypothetical protein